MTLVRISLLLCVAGISVAQQHPDFSGTWNLNVADSDYSDKHAVVPDRLVLTVQQSGDALKYRLAREKDGKKTHYDVELTISGPPYESDAAGVVTAEWKGDKLEIPTLFNPGQDRQSDQTETWSLSADGKRLIDDVLIHPPRNGPEVHIKRVLDKQR